MDVDEVWVLRPKVSVRDKSVPYDLLGPVLARSGVSGRFSTGCLPVPPGRALTGSPVGSSLAGLTACGEMFDSWKKARHHSHLAGDDFDAKLPISPSLIQKDERIATVTAACRSLASNDTSSQAISCPAKDWPFLAGSASIELGALN